MDRTSTSTVTVTQTMSGAEADLLDDVLTLAHDYVYSNKTARDQEQLLDGLDKLHKGRARVRLADLVVGITPNARARIMSRR